jgi:hypothetical protein
MALRQRAWDGRVVRASRDAIFVLGGPDAEQMYFNNTATANEVRF